MPKRPMHSCIYQGHVSHRRFRPVRHDFRYGIFMLYVDLAELPALFDRFWLWSARSIAPAWFRRADHYGEAAEPLDESIRALVERARLEVAGPGLAVSLPFHTKLPLTVLVCAVVAYAVR